MKKLRFSNRAIIGTGLVLCVLVAIIVAFLLGLVGGQAAAGAFSSRAETFDDPENAAKR